ncbi:ribosome recycling factor [Nannocystis pusilla]|jgi:ribosome recycling factor|uniref:Ribosome-recycling factor n=1 Tax=Nannocystis pusilla TaxID=889268 RepID=A0A9X3EYP5_9BACT|nr:MULTISPECIES: ribosome recycling factor [Nannocystis]MCY0994019.1 ribosome recycling factor [Nannocystis sp. ILAH1]MCY1011960.1 ribosome recycling factor [Nannocystis pusilla]MCY1066988.1 ribosome recycling factor [Nannocystis sp. RBIL2]
MNDALELAQDGMDKALDHLRKAVSKVRAGRANPAMLDEIRVENYGTLMPLNQVATVSIGDARLLVVKPWDRNMVGPIERAINAANLGINPQSDGVVIRLAIPPLTGDRRKALVKQVKDLGEEAKVAIRQSRREANEFLKEAEKGREITEDELKKALEKVQEMHDKFVKQAEEILSKKEAEITEV